MIMKNKKAISGVISYVLFIAIGIGIAMMVYAGLKYYPSIIEPRIACKEGTSLILEDYSFNGDLNILALNLKNNGLFNVDGFIFYVGEDAGDYPTNTLSLSNGDVVQDPDEKAYLTFYIEEENTPLAPGDSVDVDFSTTGFESIAVLRLQPFIFEDGKKIICDDASIRQAVVGAGVGVETCDDGIKNQDETDVDCGGSCSPCANGEGCFGNGDCLSNNCVDDICTASATNYVKFRTNDLNYGIGSEIAYIKICGDVLRGFKAGITDSNTGTCQTHFNGYVEIEIIGHVGSSTGSTFLYTDSSPQPIIVSVCTDNGAEYRYRTYNVISGSETGIPTSPDPTFPYTGLGQEVNC